MFSTKVYLKSNQINYHVTPNLSLACLFYPKSPWIEGTKESIHFSQTLADFAHLHGLKDQHMLLIVHTSVSSMSFLTSCTMAVPSEVDSKASKE